MSEDGCISPEMVRLIEQSLPSLERTELAPLEGMASYYIAYAKIEEAGYNLLFTVSVGGKSVYVYLKI